MSTRARLTYCVLLLAFQASADLIWWDGTRDQATAPPGKLLSDNPGYWGECVLTGVEYSYETEPTNPPDRWKSQDGTFGRRLLDGKAKGNWWVPAGVNHKPFVVVFDFKRVCTFTEVDVSTRCKQIATKVECGDGAEGPWRLVHQRSREECPGQMFHRLKLSDAPKGRYLRLTLQANRITYIEEVLVWGDAEAAGETPEDCRPLVPTRVIEGTAFSSIPGISKTSLSDADFLDWRQSIGDAAGQPAVWSRVATWDAITDKPILPVANEIVSELAIVMARNETECVALALTNASMQEPFTTKVALSPFRKAGGQSAAPAIAGKLRVAGAIGSRHFGVNVGPLFEEGNLLGRSLMQRYLTNAAGIMDFPQVTLSKAGSAVVWLSVTASDAAPGQYVGELSYDGGRPVRVAVEVLDLTLPKPFVWINTWSGITSMFPFVYSDRMEREVAYKQSLGVTVWSGFPTPGSVAELARKRGRTIHRRYGLPRQLVHKGYAGAVKPEDLTEKDEGAIVEHIAALAKEARDLGLAYDDWFVELWDEPGPKNSLLYGAMAKIVRKADPKVRIYSNPCFWIGNGVAKDDDVFAVLGPWYRDYVDVSVPLFLLLRDRPKCWTLFDAPRFVRACYTVSTQSAKSERAKQVQLYRHLAWDAFKRGWNGWGFYSYYGPREDPWNDFDKSWTANRPDYLMVYPGPRGPVPTRQSEAVREGWEDYCLLTLLKQQDREAELGAILKSYEAGEPMAQLRERALRAVAARQ